MGLILTYPLVHTALPGRDEDGMRRGQPTGHVAYDEATAILVGDALLTLAFETMVAHPEACAEVARAIGSRGMIAGQALDLAAAGSDVAGPADEHGDVGGVLVETLLVPETVLAVELAVVGDVYDEGVAGVAAGIEGVPNLADAPVAEGD